MDRKNQIQVLGSYTNKTETVKKETLVSFLSKNASFSEIDYTEDCTLPNKENRPTSEPISKWWEDIVKKKMMPLKKDEEVFFNGTKPKKPKQKPKPQKNLKQMDLKTLLTCEDEKKEEVLEDTSVKPMSGYFKFPPVGDNKYDGGKETDCILLDSEKETQLPFKDNFKSGKDLVPANQPFWNPRKSKSEYEKDQLQAREQMEPFIKSCTFRSRRRSPQPLDHLTISESNTFHFVDLDDDKEAVKPFEQPFPTIDHLTFSERNSFHFVVDDVDKKPVKPIKQPRKKPDRPIYTPPKARGDFNFQTPKQGRPSQPRKQQADEEECNLLNKQDISVPLNDVFEESEILKLEDVASASAPDNELLSYFTRMREEWQQTVDALQARVAMLELKNERRNIPRPPPGFPGFPF